MTTPVPIQSTIQTTLAQIGSYFGQDIPPLPEPSFVQRTLFEQPTLPAIALAVLAFVAMIALRSAGRPKEGLIALGAGLLIAVALLATGRLIQTDRERLLIAQDALVLAVATADIDGLGSRLEPDARLRGLPAIGTAGSRDGILSLVASTTGGPYRVRDYGIVKRQAVIDGPNTARTQAYIRVEPEATGTPTFAWFRMVWRLTPDGWRAVEIEPLFISGYLDYKG